MKKLNYIKPLVTCFPYEDNIEFANGSVPSKPKVGWKLSAPGVGESPNLKRETDYDW